MTPVEALAQALRIIEDQQAEIGRMRADADTLRWLLGAGREEGKRERNRPLRVRFGPSPTFSARSPEFPEKATDAARRRQARGGIGP